MTKTPDELFALATEALDAGELGAAVRHANAGLRACQRAAAPAPAAVPGLYVLAAVHAERLEDDAALARLAEISALDPEHEDAAYLEAKLRIARWDFAAADRLLRRWREDDAGPAMLHLRATLAELRGDDREANRLYRLAAGADPDSFPAPVRISDAEVQTLLQETIARLPPRVVATFENLTVDLLPVPDPVLHRDVEPEILGLYSGNAIGEPVDSAALPARVYIFKRNIERIAADRDELIEQLRITLLHEIGHHLGLDEDDLDERGLG